MSFQSKNTEEYRDIDSRVVINVGGKRFETQISTFSSYPDSLLGTMFSARNTYLLKKDSNGEIFFDRNPDAFEAILHLYIYKKNISIIAIELEIYIVQKIFQKKFYKMKSIISEL